jgi:hypothetical protein
VIERAWLSDGRMVGQMAADLPAHHQPPERPLLMEPRLIELCLQTAGIWEMDAEGRLGLPMHAGQVRFYGVPDVDDGPLFAVVERGADSQDLNAQVVDTAGNCYVQLSGYRTVPLSSLADREPLKALHAAMA